MNKLLQMTDLLTQSFGDYQIIEPLYSKAFGMVYLAEHVFLKKPYLLHTINIPEGRQEEFVIGIQEEINKVAKLNHPHILRTVNVMEHEGVLVIPSECLLDDHGEILDLATYIQNLGHPLSEEEVYQIALQIGSAIDYAWRENTIAHTGISLSSILLKKRGTDIQVMLGDFGLWHVVGITELVGQNYQTCLEHFSFLSPEQREGGIADHKSDIYAFGTLLYKLLTGRLPSGIFPMPGQIAHNLVYHWDRFLSHCLQHDPEQRLEWVVPELKNLPISTTISSELVRELRPFIKPTEIVKPEVVGDPAAIFAVDSTVTLYRPQEEEKGAVEPTHTEMVIIRSGCYGQGSSQGGRDEMPKHQIYLRSFALDIHPVTNAQFVRFLAAMGGEKDGNNNDMIHLRHARIKRSGGKLSIESGYANHPVVGVSWYGAVAYAKWIGKRLPTEAEWEIAASSGDIENVYPTGKNIERTEANFFSSDTTPVMSYQPNAFGLYDMVGNVYEWCLDWYGFHYYDVAVQEPDNPSGPVQGTHRVLRGGCWKSLKEDLRCSHRHRNNPGTMNGTYGFRCAADVAYADI